MSIPTMTDYEAAQAQLIQMRGQALITLQQQARQPIQETHRTYIPTIIRDMPSVARKVTQLASNELQRRKEQQARLAQLDEPIKESDFFEGATPAQAARLRMLPED